MCVSPSHSICPHSAQLPLAMCVARQQEGLHQFLSTSSNLRRREALADMMSVSWEGGGVTGGGEG